MRTMTPVTELSLHSGTSTCKFDQPGTVLTPTASTCSLAKSSSSQLELISRFG